MLRTLSGRIALLLFAGLCAVVAACGVLASRGTVLQLDEANQKLNQDLARYLVETSKLARGDPVDRGALSKLFANLMSVNPNIEIYLLDGDGSILAYSAAEQRVKRKTVDLRPVHDFIGGRAMYPLEGDDPLNPGRQKVLAAAPLPASGTPEAYLHVVLGASNTTRSPTCCCKAACCAPACRPPASRPHFSSPPGPCCSGPSLAASAAHRAGRGVP